MKLVFYSESNGFYKYFKDMIEYVCKNSEIVIHYVTSDPKDDILNAPGGSDTKLLRCIRQISYSAFHET